MYLSKKSLISCWLTIATLLSLILCFASTIIITTTPNNHTPHKVFQLSTLQQANVKFDPQQQNIFSISLFSRPTLIKMESVNDYNTPVSLTISNIQLVSGIQQLKFNFPVKINTLLQELVKDSQIVNVRISNNSPEVIGAAQFLKIFSYIYPIVLSILLILQLLFYSVSSIIIPKLIKWIDSHNDSNIKVLYYLATSAVLAQLVFSIWSSFCGIKFGDEGYFNLVAFYPEDVKFNIIGSFYIISHQLLNLMGGKLILFRDITIVISGTVVYYLSHSAFYLFNRLNPALDNIYNRTLIFILLFVSNSYQFLHHITPDYNNLCRYVLYAQIALLLTIFYKPRLSNSTKYYLIGLLGGITSLSLVVKFPEFFASLIVIIALLKFSQTRFWIAVGSILLGIILGLTVYFTTLQSVHDFITVLVNALTYSKIIGGTHNASSLLLQNIFDIFKVIVQAMILMMIYHFSNKLFLTTISTSTRVLLYVNLVLFYSIFACVFPQNNIEEYLVIVVKSLLTIFVLLCYENRTKYKDTKTYNLVCLVLTIFLYIGSVGTDRYIFYHIAFNIALLYIMIIIQWIIFDVDNMKIRYFILLLITTAGIILSKGFIYNTNQYHNLFEQNISYKLSNGTLYIDSNTAISLIAMKHILQQCGYHDGDYIAGFYDIPDLVFAMDAHSPVTAWYSSSIDSAKTYAGNKFIIDKFTPEIKKHLFLLVNKLKYGSGLGINLDKDYVYCGEAQINSNNTNVSYVIYHLK